jgi:hypothetical protein
MITPCIHLHLALIYSCKLAISQHDLDLIHKLVSHLNKAERSIAIVNAFVGTTMKRMTARTVLVEDSSW